MLSMADRDDPTAPDLPPTPPVDEGADARTRATVTWRGIVDEPIAPATPKKRSLFSPIGRLFSTVFVALGIKRGVNEDGSPGDRHLGRFAGIVGGVAVVLLVISMVHVTSAGYVTVPVTVGQRPDPARRGPARHRCRGRSPRSATCPCRRRTTR